MSKVLDIYVHGYSGNAESLQDFADSYSDSDFEVLVLPGFHDETILTTNQKKDIFAYAELVWGRITKLSGGKKVRLVAHSHGSMLAFAVAANHPEYIDCCVFIAPVARPAHVTSIFTNFLYLTTKLIGANNTVNILRSRPLVDAISRYQVSDKKDKNILKKISTIRRHEAQMYRSAVVDCLMHSENFIKKSGSRILDVPVVLALPVHDKIAGKKDISWYVDHIKNTTKVSILGGHISIVESPLAVSDAIKNSKASILSR